MQTLIDETLQEIAILEQEMVQVSPTCNHLTCPECEARIVKEAENRLLIQIKINERRALIEKLNQYGSNQ